MSNSNLKPLVLHAHSTGPNPYKAAIVLEALGLPYEVKLWQFGDGPNGVKGSKFLSINENGRVPAVEDPNTGVVSWESLAVVNYLLRMYDKGSKLGPGEKEQDKVDFEKWTAFLVSTLGPMIGQVNWFRHYNNEPNANALQRYEAQSYQYLAVLEAQIKKSGSEFILPKGFTAVDAHFYPWVFQHSYAQLSLDKYPETKKWLEKVGGMDAVKKAYKNVGEGQEQ